MFLLQVSMLTVVSWKAGCPHFCCSEIITSHPSSQCTGESVFLSCASFKDDDNQYIHSSLFHKLDPIMFKSTLIPLLSPQWDRAPVLPPNTVRAGDAHQGQWTESVHLAEARAGSGLPEQNPRLLQLSLHLLSGASSSRRSRGTQTRKLISQG